MLRFFNITLLSLLLFPIVQANGLKVAVDVLPQKEFEEVMRCKEVAQLGPAVFFDDENNGVRCSYSAGASKDKVRAAQKLFLLSKTVSLISMIAVNSSNKQMSLSVLSFLQKHFPDKRYAFYTNDVAKFYDSLLKLP